MGLGGLGPARGPRPPEVRGSSSVDGAGGAGLSRIIRRARRLASPWTAAADRSPQAPFFIRRGEPVPSRRPTACPEEPSPSDQADLPAQEAPPRQGAWLPRAHEDQGRPQRARRPARAWPQEAHAPDARQAPRGTVPMLRSREDFARLGARGRTRADRLLVVHYVANVLDSTTASASRRDAAWAAPSSAIACADASARSCALPRRRAPRAGTSSWSPGRPARPRPSTSCAARWSASWPPCADP